MSISISKDLAKFGISSSTWPLLYSGRFRQAGGLSKLWETAAAYLGYSGFQYDHFNDQCTGINGSCADIYGGRLFQDILLTSDLSYLEDYHALSFEIIPEIIFVKQVLVEGSSTEADSSSPLQYFLVFSGLLIFLIISWVAADEFAAYLNKKRENARACTVLQSTRAFYSVALIFILVLLHGTFYNGNTLLSTTTSSRFEIKSKLMNGRIPMIVEHGTECLKAMQQSKSLISYVLEPDFRQYRVQEPDQFFREVVKTKGEHTGVGWFDSNVMTTGEPYGALLNPNTSRQDVEKLRYLVLTVFSYEKLMWLSEMSMSDEEFVKYKKLFTMEQEPPYSFSPLSLVNLETFLYVIGGLLLCSIATFLLEIVAHRSGVLKRAFKRLSRTPLFQACFPQGL